MLFRSLGAEVKPTIVVRSSQSRSIYFIAKFLLKLTFAFNRRIRLIIGVQGTPYIIGHIPNFIVISH